jgi:hypothetical protein
LSIGYQAAQCVHAARLFQDEFPEIEGAWFKKSNYIVLLTIANEESLSALINEAKEKQIRLSIFKEPDLNNEITAVTLEPGIRSKKLCRNLKLMG